jgi:5-methylthioadenosine/S-adenosylhomocysteine deaminase
VPETLVTNLVHAARGSDVSLVMVDGRIVVEDGRLADSRWADLLQRVRPIARELLRVGSE